MNAGNNTVPNKKGEWKDTHSIGNVRSAKKDLE
jgi:hypothetical protein